MYAELVTSGTGGIGCGINDDYSVGGKTVAEWREQLEESRRQLTEGGEINASGQEAWSMLKKADREILDSVLTSFPRYYINYQLPEDRMSNIKYGLVPRTVFALLTYDELMTI